MFLPHFSCRLCRHNTTPVLGVNFKAKQQQTALQDFYNRSLATHIGHRRRQKEECADLVVEVRPLFIPQTSQIFFATRASAADAGTHLTIVLSSTKKASSKN